VIGGYTDPRGSRQGPGARLLVGYYDANGRLTYAGKVGTGFTQATLLSLRESLSALETRHLPVRQRQAAAGGACTGWSRDWSRQIAFAEWTSDALLRQPPLRGACETTRTPRK